MVENVAGLYCKCPRGNRFRAESISCKIYKKFLEKIVFFVESIQAFG
jgi:hypothetical protein